MRKSEACCARVKGRIVREEAEQRRAARAASTRKSSGRELTPKMIADLARSKAAVEVAKQGLVEHEAEHAEVAA